jgi:hypothetical protein
MPTNASRLSDFGSGIGTQGAVLQVDNANQRIGIGTTNPQAMLQVGTGVSVYGNSGIVSATAFYGDGSNLTGININYVSNAGIATYATTAGIATNAQGLTGTPNIVINNIAGAAATFSGNVSIAGTLTYEDVTNVDSVGLITARSGVRINSGGLVVTAGVSTLTTLIPDETRFVTVAEKLTRIDGNTVNLTYSSNGSNIGLATNPSGNITLNVTGIPTSSDFDNHVITFSVFVTNTGTARSCTAVNLNGVSKTINWAGGSLGEATSGVTTSNGIDIYSFTGINTVGSASTTANYRVLGVVNGGYR